MRRKALNPDADLTFAPAALVKKSTVVYGIMILLGLAIVGFGHKTLPRALSIPSEPYEEAGGHHCHTLLAQSLVDGAQA